MPFHIRKLLKRNSVLFFIKYYINILFIILLFSYFIIPNEKNEYFQILMVFIAIFSIYLYYIYQVSYYSKFPWINISSLFIFGYFIVFFQVTILDIFGYVIPDRYFDFIWADESIINISIYLSTLGLVSYFVGFFNKGKNKNIISKKTNSATYLLTIGSYIFYILFFLTSGSYMYGEYNSGDASSLNVYFFKFFEVMLSASIIVKLSHITSIKKSNISIFEYINFFGKPIILLTFWHVLFSLFVGDRGPVISFVLLLFGIYFIRWNKTNIIKIILIIFIASSIMSIIGDIRLNRYSGESYSNRVIMAFQNLSSAEERTRPYDAKVPFSQTAELAMSARTFNHVLYNIPKNYDYMYGLIQLKYIYSIIPGFSGVMTKLLYGDDYKYFDSANFTTYLIQGQFPLYGDGTSILSDFYIDFGIFGIIIGMYLFGLFTKRNEHKLFYNYQKPTLSFISILILFSHSLYLSRSALLLDLANIILIYLVILVNKYIMEEK